MKKNNDLFVCAVLEKRLLVMCIVFAVFLFIMIEMSEFNTKKTVCQYKKQKKYAFFTINLYKNNNLSCKMLENLVNFGAIVVGSLLGLVFKKAIKEEHKNALHKALGLAVIIIGLNGVITNMITLVKNGDAFSGTLSSSGELLLIASLVIGTFIGSLLKIEERFNGLAEKVEEMPLLQGKLSSKKRVFPAPLS